MPKPRKKDSGFASGSLEETLGTGGWKNMSDLLSGRMGGRKTKKAAAQPPPTPMNRKQVSKSAGDLGYDMTKEGRFVARKVASKKGMGGHRGS